jgi:type IV secretory pathway VirB2 component (pilin)
MALVNVSAHRWTARILLAVALCLLAEQWAFAAHLCAGPASMSGGSMRMTMVMPMHGRFARTAAAIACVAHCTAQPASVAHSPVSNAPPRFDIARPAVPAILPVMRSVRLVADRTAVPRAPPRFRTLLYCSLLI